jgi:RNA polymerase sigma factor (sigma-70 family)
MVWGVCRRNLANHDDAEDAFQATFLVFLRKSASIRSRELLANWLYRVAYKTAGKARQMAAKRRTREEQVEVMPEPPVQPPYEDEFGPELREQLDQELSRLPDKYRIAIVLCDLQGRSRPEVAQELRLPEGTVGSRLARGRALLAKRLARRGLTLAATSFAAVCSQQAASSAVPVALLTNTIEATSLLAAGHAVAAGLISNQVTPLTEGVLQALAVAKHKTVGVVVVLAALVLGGGAFAYHRVAGQEAKPAPPAEPIEEPSAEADRQAHSEIVQMVGAVNKFKQLFKVPYIPSRIRLCEDGGYNPNDALDADSRDYLKRLFPKLQYPVDWNGDGITSFPNGKPQRWELEGDQCLVFFLGGLQVSGPNSCVGFSTNPANPMQPGGRRINGGAFFQFPVSRLFARRITSPSGLSSGTFFSFQDPYLKNYYAFFSSYKSANGYNRYFDYHMGLNPVGQKFGPVSDCRTLGVWPYASALGSLPRYQNPETIQIICAGTNGQFGSGTVIVNSPMSPAQNFPGQWLGGPTWDSLNPNVSPGGSDDLSNFSAWRLGERHHEQIVDGELRITLTGLKHFDYGSLRERREVVVLQMANEDVDDQTLEHLKGMDQLRKLNLSDTRITDKGLALVAELPRLQELYLARTKITDEGFQKHLAPKETLLKLDLTGTRVKTKTKRAWKKLKPLEREYGD